MIRHPAIVMSGIGLVAAMALWIGLSADDEVIAVTSANANAQARRPPADPPASLGRSMGARAAPTAVSSVPPLSARPSPTTGLVLPIAVMAPQNVLVGEMNDLTVSVGPNAGLSEISFAVQFDANLLQVRAGTQGGWAVGVGANPRFAVEISSAEDRVQIRSIASDPRAGLGGGSVATVQFQAVATGTTSVLITDVAAKDSNGRSIASSVSASNLQVTVGSVPPPALARPSDPASVEQPVVDASEKGD